MSKQQLNDLHNKTWDSKKYKQTYYGELDPENQFFMEQYFKHFSTFPELVKTNQNERAILDLGCGPCVCWGAAIAAANFKGLSITYSDYMANNRQDISKWMEKADDKADWSTQLEFLSKLSGKSATDIADDLRSGFKEVLPCDIRSPPMPIPGMESKFDIIYTNLCYEACCANMEEWKMAVINTCKMLKHGGIFIIGGISNLTSYRVGDTDYPTVSVNEESAKEVLSDRTLRLDILHTESKAVDGAAAHEGEDHDGVFFLIAKKH